MMGSQELRLVLRFMEAEGRRLRPIEIIKKMRISKATLHKYLKVLVRRGVLIREIDSSTKKYPPPVYYFLDMNSQEVQEIAKIHNYAGKFERDSKERFSPQEYVRNVSLWGSLWKMTSLLGALRDDEKRIENFGPGAIYHFNSALEFINNCKPKVRSQVLTELEREIERLEKELDKIEYV